MAKAGALYEQDFFLWTKEQAAALRAGTESSNPPSSTGESLRTGLSGADPIPWRALRAP